MNELTFPLAGFRYAVRTNLAKHTLCNKDAALLVLAANGGILDKEDVIALLRGWRPLGDGSTESRTRFYSTRELRFDYLFNAYYGHITDRYDYVGPDRKWHTSKTGHYSKGAYMWRPSRAKAAISLLGMLRLEELSHQAVMVGIDLDLEIVKFCHANPVRSEQVA
jgi:hypothetical protein